jgi:hypothetical protein
MRFAIVVVGAAATGALSVGAVRTMAPPNAQMFQAVRALGGNLADVKLDDINPLKAYADVKQKITSANFGGSINVGSPVTVQWPKLGDMSLSSKLQIDPAAMQKAMAASAASRIQQNLNHMEDVRNFARNPAGWHGAPPF